MVANLDVRKLFHLAGPLLGYLLISLALSVLLARCKPGPSKLSTAQIAAIDDSVSELASDISKAVSRQGPVAWLRYFSQSPDFYMASDGSLRLVGYSSARIFILDTLVKQWVGIRLEWSGLRIDPSSPESAMMGASFREWLTDSSGRILAVQGYFTGWARKTDQGWKLAIAHWSTMPRP
jgi:SnoaL-like domain